MSSAHDRLVALAILVSESVWLYIGLVIAWLTVGTWLETGVGRSPLDWIPVIAVLGVSYLVTRGFQIIIMPTARAYALQGVTGAVVIYLMLGTQIPSGGQGLDLVWVGSLMPELEGDTLRAIAGTVMGALLWWRGGGLASAESPVNTLSVSFRLGIVVLAFAALVDIFNDEDLIRLPLVFLFFAAGLVGLSLGHILPASRRAVEDTAWPKVIGGVVSAVLLLGLLVSFLPRLLRGGEVPSLLSGPALVVLNALGTVIFFVIIVPALFIVFWVVEGAKAVIGAFTGESREIAELPVVEQPVSSPPELPPAGGFGGALERLQEGSLWDTLLRAGEWTAAVVIILIVLLLLLRAFRRRVRWHGIELESERESLEADPASDIAKLLFNLIPKRLRQKRSQGLRVPEGDAGVVDVFRVYFGLLTLAEERGHPRRPTETTVEYQRTLVRIFPANLVHMVTAAFNRACYGHHPAPRQQIDEMRASLERLVSGGT